MKIERTKNATRNIFFGVIQKIYQIFIPFLMRTAMIHLMGVEYLGLSSLFTSILSVLSLAELGVGSAMVYSMYKPIAEDDSKTICALMRLYRTYYRIIGIVIAILGVILLPFIPKLIKGDIPAGLNVYILYLLNLFATVLSYWLFAYKNCLLFAHQRNDISTKISLISTTIQYVLQFAVLYFLRDYYIYIIVSLCTTAANNVVTAQIVNKIFPNYKPIGTLDKSSIKIINGRIKDLFTAKLGTKIVNTADTIVISAFLGLSMLAMYQNYYYIMNSVVGFVVLIFSSATAGIGNSIVVETSEKNYFDFKKLAFLTIWISTICISCFACLYQPFMRIWVGEEFLLDMSVVILFCIYFYLYIINHLSAVYKDAAGIWHQDRFRPLISGLVNLFLNLIFVKYWGIYAILISTIVSYLIVAMPWLIINLFKSVFKRSPIEYVFVLVKGAATAACTATICYFICSCINVDGVLEILISGFICVVVSNTALFVIYRRNSLFNPMLDLFDNISKKKFHNLLVKLKYEKR